MPLSARIARFGLAGAVVVTSGLLGDTFTASQAEAQPLSTQTIAGGPCATRPTATVADVSGQLGPLFEATVTVQLAAALELQPQSQLGPSPVSAVTAKATTASSSAKAAKTGHHQSAAAKKAAQKKAQKAQHQKAQHQKAEHKASARHGKDQPTPSSHASALPTSSGSPSTSPSGASNSPSPSQSPSQSPTQTPSATPTPSVSASKSPTKAPSSGPSGDPTQSSSPSPSATGSPPTPRKNPSPSNSPSPTKSPTKSPTPTPTKSAKPAKLCVEVEPFTNNPVRPGNSARYAVFVWSAISTAKDVSVAATINAVAHVGDAHFTVCPTGSGTSCKIGALPVGQADELQASAKVGPHAKAGGKITLAAAATGKGAKPAHSGASVTIAKAGTPTPSSTPTPDPTESVPALPTVPAEPTLPGTGLLPTDGTSPTNPAGLFPTVSPGSSNGSGVAGGTKPRSHRIDALSAGATLPLNPRLIGGQLAGLAVLAGAVAIAIARLSLRKPKPQSGQNDSQ
jgi:hypothetical protein